MEMNVATAQDLNEEQIGHITGGCAQCVRDRQQADFSALLAQNRESNADRLKVVRGATNAEAEKARLQADINWYQGSAREYYRMARELEAKILARGHIR